MMEFTCNGVVRWGFGFDNPNHAAALFCALLPLLWGWKKRAWLGFLLSGVLCAALILTCSRTGFLVLVFELAAFTVFSRDRENSRFLLGLLLFALFFAGCLYGLGRCALDGAVVNRPKIWLAGLKLYAANPWGVGTGNSGEIVSAFLLPEGISCRTLVSTHLTLLTEAGLTGGIFWLMTWGYALSRSVSRPRIWIALAGLFLSAGSSTVLDGGTLFDYQTESLNFWLSWGLAAYAAGLLIAGVWGRILWKNLVIAVGSACLLCLIPLLFRSPETPKIRNGYIVKVFENEQIPLLVRGDDWSLNDLRPFFTKGALIPLRSEQPLPPYPGKITPSATLLFGNACTVSKHFPKPLYYVCPPEFVSLSSELAGVYLPVFGDFDALRTRLNATDIPVLPMP